MGQGMMMAFSIGSTLLAAKMQRDAYEIEAQQNEENAEMAKMQADQQENSRRSQLLQIMSALNVSESSRGLSIGTGGSSKALRENEINLAKADLSSIKLMGLSKARQFKMGASASRTSGKAAMLGAGTQVATSYRRYKIDKGDWKVIS